MSILAATDFSPSSRTAVRLAAAIARGRSVPLVIVHAVELPIIEVDPVPIGLASFERDLTAAAESMLAQEVAALRAAGTQVETAVTVGDPVLVISDESAARTPELVVVGTHGRKGAARFFLGSVAEAVVRKATCPVLVTGDREADLARWGGRGALRLAVATDGSHASEAALSWSRVFEQARSCELSILRVYWPPEAALRYGLDDPWGGHPRGPELARLVERDARKEAESFLGHVPSVRLRVASNDAGEALADEAALLGVDAMVIGIPRHRTSRWAALAPAAVLRAAQVPVLCVPDMLASARRELRPTTAVLLPTDFSEASRRAIPAAYGLLRSGGGHVELCTVHALSTGSTADLLPGPRLSAEERVATEARLRALIPPDAPAAGITTNVSVVEGQSIPEAIVATAERLGVDVVAVGSHGRSGLPRAVLGSVADEVARRSPCPVLVVGDQVRRERG